MEQNTCSLLEENGKQFNVKDVTAEEVEAWVGLLIVANAEYTGGVDVASLS